MPAVTHRVPGAIFLSQLRAPVPIHSLATSPAVLLAAWHAAALVAPRATPEVPPALSGALLGRTAAHSRAAMVSHGQYSGSLSGCHGES